MGLKQSKADSLETIQPQPLIVENSVEIDFSKTVILDPHRYNKTTKNWEKIAIDEHTNVQTKSLKFVTYNVWFEAEFIDKRMESLFQILEQENADIICLQEVLPRFIKSMCEKDWIRKNYVISDSLGFSCIPYGVAILTRIPSVLQMKLIPTNSNMSRRLLVLELGINNLNVKVGTMHFESLYHSDLRREQIIQSCQELTTNCSHSFLMGDFNFGEQNKMEEQSLKENCLDQGWKDTWHYLRSNEPGATIDVNYPHEHWKPARFDRVLVKSDCWLPSAVKLVGDKSIGESESGKKIFPSDHIGLVAEFVWQEPSQHCENQN